MSRFSDVDSDDDDPRFRPDASEADVSARLGEGRPAGRQLQPGPAGGAVSGALRDWQQQMARLERLQGQLADLQALEAQQREARTRELQPLRQLRRERMRALALRLASWLDDKALSQRQREVARERVCVLAHALAGDGDAEMRALHDRFSPRSWADKRHDAAQDLRRHLEGRLGETLDLGDAALTPEAVWHVGLARLEEAQEVQRDRRKARADARRARRGPQPTAGTPPVPADDADRILRQLYRQLASALHPDRESDEAERRRKTALMGEANAAYGRSDLLTLMRLQGEAGPGPEAEGAAGARLRSMTALLRRQVADLERQRAARQGELALTFGLPAGQVAQPQTLMADLQAKCQGLLMAVAAREADLAQLDDLPALRRWLNGPWSA
ncbi:MAG: hypothetical protein R3E94_03785 [Burkholderiaceae bacterium]